ncbi:phospholipase [Photobacterium alginatilyticum]|uniref:phospholipase n=1 Tax=Photobacterium alginatilyticum TaxID=1775171 RepID=UPI004068A8B1
MIFESPIEEAKFHRVMIVDALGFCYIILPYGRALGNNPEAAEYRFRHPYWATHLLNSHDNRWGYRFELRKLYLQFFTCPLIYHKSDQEILAELSNYIACGELLVYKVDNLLCPSIDILSVGIPMPSPTPERQAKAESKPQSSRVNRSKAVLQQGGRLPADAPGASGLHEQDAYRLGGGGSKGLQDVSPLAQTLIAEVSAGASPKAMLETLETNTSKALRRQARKDITARASSSLPDVARRFSNDMDGAEKALLAEHIYSDGPMPPDSGWRQASEQELQKSGFSKKDFKIKDSQFKAGLYIPEPSVFGDEAAPVVVFKGTSGMEDWKNNLQQGLDFHSDYYEKAVELGDIARQRGIPVDFSGHSLGGGLASAAGKTASRETTTFNAAGLHKNTIPRYVPEVVPAGDNIVTGYRIDGELLTFIQEDIPLVSHFAADAARDTARDTTLARPDSLTKTAIASGAAGAALAGTAAGVAAYGGVKAKEKLDHHGMAAMRQALENRKVADLHQLTQAARR